MNKQVFSIRSRIAIWVIAIFSVLTLMLLPVCVAIAQKAEPVYRRYSVDDGLPSSMLYHAYQDSKGYIWFGTANGVSRFDGYKFENFDLQSGLVDNDVFEIYEDYKHRIWFIPMSGKLSYYEDGKIFHFQYNNKLKYSSAHRGPIKNGFYVDTLDNVYISMRRSGLYAVSPEGLVTVKKNENDIGLVIEEGVDGNMLFSNILNSNFVISFKGRYQTFKTSSMDLGYNLLNNPIHIYAKTLKDSSSVFCFFYGVAVFKKGKLTFWRKYGTELIWMSIDNSNNLWICSGKGGAYCFANSAVAELPTKTILENYKVSSVLQDREGAYWFTTLNDGVFYCPNLDVINYTKESGLEDNRINAVAAGKEGVYVGYDFGFVDLLSNQGIIKYKTPNKIIQKPEVKNLFIDTINKKVWISGIEKLFYLQNGKVSAMELTPSLTTVIAKKVFVDSNGSCWFASTYGLINYDGKKYLYESFANKDFTGIVYDVVKDMTGTLWFCSINGLWKFSEGKRYEYMGEKNPLFAITSYSMILNPIDSSLWIGTNGNGIVIKKGDLISQITKNDGLSSNSISQMYFSDSTVWVATRNGLSRIKLNKGKFKIVNYTKANGLPTNQITSVCEYKDIIYVGTPKGLTVFNKYIVEDNVGAPEVLISNFLVNGRVIDNIKQNVELDYNENSLDFNFLGFVYRNEGEVNYRYRMLGADSSWVYTQIPNCHYNEVSDGIYRFEVEAQSFNGKWSSKPAYVDFTIHPPFWKRLWFLMLLTLSISGVFFFIYRVRVNAINRRNELLQNINLYKQQSLRQQMNPHFIFNTLNSIQLYILEKDSISSHKYLTKFARLMRMTLDNSLYSSIPLKDELEALRIYLDLERLRLEDKFEYSIDYGADESILNFTIPTLIIQPFVENAIWHGISLRKDQMGWVKISILDKGNAIVCVVEDNGVGRAFADRIRQSRRKEHKSRGSQITQQRIDLLGQMFKEKFSIVYKDLVDSMGEPLGTKVTIVIPKVVNANVNN